MEETQKRKFSEIDNTLSEIERDIRALYTHKHTLEVELYGFKRELDGNSGEYDAQVLREDMEEFQEDVGIEIKKLRRAIDKMNKKMEGMFRYSLTAFKIQPGTVDPQYDFDDWMLHVPGSPQTIWSDEE